MLWLGALFLVKVVIAIDPSKSWPVLGEDVLLDLSQETLDNGFPRLTTKTKAYIEQCVIDPFINSEVECGNNPYAGLVRLAFHDCGTYDKTASTNKGGCNAWMTKKCTQFDQCEYTAHENNGLKMWVDPLDKAYDSAKVNGNYLSKYLSRADFWHLAAFRAVRLSSSGKVKADYHAGRVDPNMPNPGPRFPGRLPDAFAWSEMQRVAKRNGMDDLTAAALLGAHTLGQCHPTTSGYQGAWDPTPFVFDELFWDSLLDLKWFVHDIEAVNSQTGQKTQKTQFSLGGDNFDRSVMLFSDMEIHLDLDSCNVNANDVANGKCKVNKNPFSLPSALRAWADSPQSFYNVFANAWEIFSKWGCTNCYDVDEYSSKVDCPSGLYKHTCKKGYSQGTSYWKPGWKSPALPPTSKPGYTTPKPVPYGKPTPTPKPTTKPPYKPTPTPTSYKPTTKPPTYKPTPTPYRPPTTTRPPVTYPPTTTPIITGTISKAPPRDTTTPPPTTTPETTPPETTPPETTSPETTYPETTPPETTYPETTPPETTYPETTTYPPTTTYAPPTTTYAPPTTTTYPPPPTTTYAPPTTPTTCPTTTPTYTYPPTTTPTYTYPPTTTPTYTPPPTTTPTYTYPPTTTPTYTPPPTTTPTYTLPPTSTPKPTTPRYYGPPPPYQTTRPARIPG